MNTNWAIGTTATDNEQTTSPLHQLGLPDLGDNNLYYDSSWINHITISRTKQNTPKNHEFHTNQTSCPCKQTYLYWVMGTSNITACTKTQVLAISIQSLQHKRFMQIYVTAHPNLPKHCKTNHNINNTIECIQIIE